MTSYPLSLKVMPPPNEKTNIHWKRCLQRSPCTKKIGREDGKRNGRELEKEKGNKIFL
jgi:hypothetical protein